MRLIAFDPHPSMRGGFSVIFEEQRDIKLEFVGEEQALLAALAAKPPDVLSMDMKLERDPLKLLREVRERFPDVPVVMITINNNEAVVAEAIRLGVVDYVDKMHWQDAVSAVRSAAEGKSPLEGGLFATVKAKMAK